ncbi:MAG TPA: methyltransferase [Terriglobales bacterium]|nr:methyltransferase [Terriglobales bacterium]
MSGARAGSGINVITLFARLYRYVRHPMYAAVALLLFGSALLLGSCWGVVGGLVIVLMVARRAVPEERTLRQGLDGYDAYAEQVKYRLIPGISWCGRGCWYRRDVGYPNTMG